MSSRSSIRWIAAPCAALALLAGCGERDQQSNVNKWASGKGDGDTAGCQYGRLGFFGPDRDQLACAEVRLSRFDGDDVAAQIWAQHGELAMEINGEQPAFRWERRTISGWQLCAAQDNCPGNPSLVDSTFPDASYQQVTEMPDCAWSTPEWVLPAPQPETGREGIFRLVIHAKLGDAMGTVVSDGMTFGRSASGAPACGDPDGFLSYDAAAGECQVMSSSPGGAAEGGNGTLTTVVDAGCCADKLAAGCATTETLYRDWIALLGADSQCSGSTTELCPAELDDLAASGCCLAFLSPHGECQDLSLSPAVPVQVGVLRRVEGMGGGDDAIGGGMPEIDPADIPPFYFELRNRWSHDGCDALPAQCSPFVAQAVELPVDTCQAPTPALKCGGLLPFLCPENMRCVYAGGSYHAPHPDAMGVCVPRNLF